MLERLPKSVVFDHLSLADADGPFVIVAVVLPITEDETEELRGLNQQFESYAKVEVNR